MALKLKFENQAFQLQAVNNTVTLFNGMNIFNQIRQLANDNELLSYDVVANSLQIDTTLLLDNLQSIQLNNGLENYSNELYYGDYPNIPNFSLEMETGTGKTYVYLRSIFELNKCYGLTKFIIVVPSDAIRIGTLKTLEITKEHFKSEFNNVSYDYYQYDSSKINKVRDFATANTVQVMVMTIAAFNKQSNNIYEYKDRFGEYRPIDLIKEVKPVVIIDEPQSVDNTEKSKEAIKELSPLFILRYSATHREMYNQIYKLDAIDAFSQKLVKQIEVASIEDATFTDVSTKPYIKVIEITPKLELSLELAVQDKKGKITNKTIKKILKGSNLVEKTNNDAYTGYVVEDFSRDNGLKLANLDYEIALGQSIGNEANIELKTRVMIRLVIENHIKRELTLAPQQIKVLSLFFINKVADYREHREDSQTDAWLAKMFIEQLKVVLQTSIGQKYIKQSQELFSIDLTNETELNKLHDGYFAKDKNGGYKDCKSDTKDADDIYELIMRDKEKLLNQQTPLRFIFSHSALKEGWDNPNVFQVCVLQAGSNEFKRRQQIGRGMRLCVNSEGVRIRDSKINTLTVIAGESYSTFAANLQKEYEVDAKIKFGYIHPLIFVNKFLQTDTSLDNDRARELSIAIHEVLKQNQYIDEYNTITERGQRALKSGLLELNIEKLKPFASQVEDVLNNLCKNIPIKNQKNKIEVNVNQKVFISPEFKQLWNKINQKTIYQIHLDTDKLINNSIVDIDVKLDINSKKITITRAKLNIDAYGIGADLMHMDNIELNNSADIDVVKKIELATSLTRKTIIAILQSIKKEKLELINVNNVAFIEQVVDILNNQKIELLVSGIKYHKIADLGLSDSIVHIEECYAQSLIQQNLDYGYNDNIESNIANANELGISSDNLATKFLYDVLRYDSDVEFNFFGYNSSQLAATLSYQRRLVSSPCSVKVFALKIPRMLASRRFIYKITKLV